MGKQDRGQDAKVARVIMTVLCMKEDVRDDL